MLSIIKDLVFMGLLKILLIIILVLWALRMMVTLLFPYLMAMFVGKMQREAQKQYERQTGAYTHQHDIPKPDGKIRVDYVPPKSTKNKPSTGGRVGEFIDFEEIK